MEHAIKIEFGRWGHSAVTWERYVVELMVFSITQRKWHISLESIEL